MLSPNLEKTLREAYQIATNNKHEYVTLEHLLLSLLEFIHSQLNSSLSGRLISWLSQ